MIDKKNIPYAVDKSNTSLKQKTRYLFARSVSAGQNSLPRRNYAGITLIYRIRGATPDVLIGYYIRRSTRLNGSAGNELRE